MFSVAQEAACNALTSAAEATGGLSTLMALVQHDGLAADERDRDVAGIVVFHALAVIVTAFDLRVSRLPTDALASLLELLDTLLSRDASLAECATLCLSFPLVCTCFPLSKKFPVPFYSALALIATAFDPRVSRVAVADGRIRLVSGAA